MPDSQLASEIGANVARLVYADLDEIGRAVDLEVGQVSFSVTCVFFRDKEGVVKVRLEPRKRIPQAVIEIKLGMRSGQLSLFD